MIHYTIFTFLRFLTRASLQSKKGLDDALAAPPPCFFPPFLSRTPLWSSLLQNLNALGHEGGLLF